MKRRYPNAYIIGAQKSGTTSLFNWIGQHPDVYANLSAKDFPFFTDEEIFKNKLRDFQNIFQNAGSKKIILGGDANLMYVPGAVERMFLLIPNTKLIAILRNPVTRAFSAWRFTVEKGIEKRTFYEAILSELKGDIFPPDSWKGRQMNYLDHGLYSKQLKRIYSYYSKEGVMVLIYEEVIKDPLKNLKEIFQFLGITDLFIPDFTKENVTLGGQRSKLVSYFLYRRRAHNNPFWELIRLIIPKNVRTKLRLSLQKYNRIPLPPPPFPEDVKSLLKDFYSDEVKELETLLCRKLDIWKDN